MCQKIFSEDAMPAQKLEVGTLRLCYETRNVDLRVPSRCRFYTQQSSHDSCHAQGHGTKTSLCNSYLYMLEFLAVNAWMDYLVHSLVEKVEQYIVLIPYASNLVLCLMMSDVERGQIPPVSLLSWCKKTNKVLVMFMTSQRWNFICLVPPGIVSLTFCPLPT
jgi:hypothetical protein